MAYLSADDLLAGTLGEEQDMEVDGLGTVRIRPLTAIEVMRLGSNGTDSVEMLVRTLLTGLVTPALTREQIERAPVDVMSRFNEIGSRIATISAIGGGEELEKKAGGGS